MLLTPSLLLQTVTPYRTPSPSSVTYFMDGPCTGKRDHQNTPVSRAKGSATLSSRHWPTEIS